MRLLVQNGISYGAFSTALKRVFLSAAQEELAARGMTQTDSALTLLSGVHRRDVRTLLRPGQAPDDDGRPAVALSLASEIVLCWLSQRRWRDPDGSPRVLPRGAADDGFDAMVASVSSDVRPRAVLDELVRLGVAEVKDGAVKLLVRNFVPRKKFGAMATLFADNVHDHLATAAANLQFDRDLLEQAVHVDQISAASADRLHQAARQAWKSTFDAYFPLAQQCFDADAQATDPKARAYRARVGMYFLIDEDKGHSQ